MAMLIRRAAVLFTLLLVGIPTASHAARTDWREMNVGRFHIYSTMRDGPTRNIARHLQTFDLTVGKLLQAEDGLPDVPTMVYILDDEDFNKYAAPTGGLGGFFLQGDARNIIVINGTMDFEAVLLAVFEDYTFYIQRSTRAARLPPWFVVGYGEVFSSFQLALDVVTLGHRPRGTRIMLDDADWISMRRLLTVDPKDPDYVKERLSHQFDGESWALVHMIMFDDTSLLAPVDRYLTDLDQGMAENDAFAKEFPFDKETLDRRLKQLISGPVIRTRKLKLSDPLEVARAPVTHMTVAAADEAMVRLMASLGRPSEVIDALIQVVLDETRYSPAAVALSARYAKRPRDRVPAEVVQRLAAVPDLAMQVRIDLADASLVESGEGATGKTTLALLDGTVWDRDPPIEAVMLWARAAKVEDVPPATVIAVVSPASTRAPHNTQLLATLATANEALGAKDRARALYLRIVQVSRDEATRTWAQQQADSPRLHAVSTAAAVPAASAATH